MRDVLGFRRHKQAQTLVFFMIAFGAIIMLCGLAIDSGVLYLAKARMSRAVDGAALAAVGNFHRSNDPLTNRNAVATIMRNFAVANFPDLGSVSTVPTVTSGASDYTYNFNDSTRDTNGQFKRFIQVTLTVGAGGSITTADCEARCPVTTYFIGFYGSFFRDLKVSSSAVATRNPRLIMIVLDRSASMLQPGGGAYGLAPAVVQFLNFFDTSSDNIGIVSFGSSARLEMPMTTNFLIAGTNNLINTYQVDAISGVEQPAVDPEQIPAKSNYDPTFSTNGVRRFKFGGQTAAADGIRLGLEQLMANSGFNNPDVIKYLVIFTDGKWNVARTLFAAPGYTNTIIYDTNTGAQASGFIPGTAHLVGNTAGWSTNLASDVHILPIPTLSPMPYVTNALSQAANGSFSILSPNHVTDWWMNTDSSGKEPLSGSSQSSGTAGTPATIAGTTWLGQYAGLNNFTSNVDVWLQPGSVAHLYSTNSLGNYVLQSNYVSNYNAPTNHVSINLKYKDKLELVVPGYIVDGLAYDGLDLTYSDFSNSTDTGFQNGNYNEPFQWPDDTLNSVSYLFSSTYTSNSLMRQLMFRNYVNLMTGFYIYRPDEPYGNGHEPLITELNPPGAPRPLYGLGPYYPTTAFYWPFDLVGVDYDATYALINGLADPDVSGNEFSRHASYSINMQSTAAAPEWAGELFYKSISGSGTNVVSGTGTTSASQIMTSSDWQNNLPSFANVFQNVMTSESAHNTNISPAPSVWRPLTFNGTNGVTDNSVSGPVACTPGGSDTGGYITDGAGHYFKNSMAWSGRPTHYYDFTTARWEVIDNNHVKNNKFLQIGNWEAYEYCWHARAMGVTIYTVGFGGAVSAAQQVLLAQLANATNSTASSTSIVYNPSQPIGQQFYGTNTLDISNDFYQVGQAINAALTQ